MKKSIKQESAKTEKGKMLILLCIVIIIALVAIIAMLLRREDTSQEGSVSESEEPRRNVVVTESNAEEAAAQMAAEDYAEPGYYIANMTTEWHFPAGDAVSPDARVDNVLGNTNPVYFDVFLAENETEPVYRSPVIPVGSFLEHIALDVELDAGTYECVVVYHLVDEEQNTISTLRVAIQIIVETGH